MHAYFHICLKQGGRNICLVFDKEYFFTFIKCAYYRLSYVTFDFDIHYYTHFLLCILYILIFYLLKKS